jgi:hypothetical protein
MSVMTPGKPDGLTRAAAPARRRAGSADRGQTAGVPRQRRRAQGRPGAGAVRHLRAVPDPGRQRSTLPVPDAARARDAASAPRVARVPRTMRVPGPRAAPEARRAPITPAAPEARRAPTASAAPETGRAPSGRAAPETRRARGTRAGPAGMSGSRPRSDRAVLDDRGPRNAGRAGTAPGPRHGAAVRRHGMPARDTRMASRRSTVRLTRRGRIVVATLLTALCLLLVALAWMAITARAQAADGGLPQGAVYRNLTSVVVHPGQTLWSIASQAEPSADPRVVMQLIIELNALHGTSIEPGQHLWVPHG